MHQPEISVNSFRYFYLLRFQKSFCRFLTPPFQKSAKVHNEKYRAAGYDRVAADDQAKGDPAQARHHEDQKTKLIFVSEQRNRHQTTNRRKPIDPVVLKQIHFFVTATASISTFASRGSLAA